MLANPCSSTSQLAELAAVNQSIPRDPPASSPPAFSSHQSSPDVHAAPAEAQINALREEALFAPPPLDTGYDSPPIDAGEGLGAKKSDPLNPHPPTHTHTHTAKTCPEAHLVPPHIVAHFALRVAHEENAAVLFDYSSVDGATLGETGNPDSKDEKAALGGTERLTENLEDPIAVLHAPLLNADPKKPRSPRVRKLENEKKLKATEVRETDTLAPETVTTGSNGQSSGDANPRASLASADTVVAGSNLRQENSAGRRPRGRPRKMPT
jgi:hypothetical protein